MNREGIRRLAAEELGLKTSPYRFADTETDCFNAIRDIGLPRVVKPVMSSSGKGQSTAHSKDDIAKVWAHSQEGGRTGKSRVIAMVIFSELSPRPHDMGFLTLISQDLSEFALHARAILGLPIPGIRLYGPADSSVIFGQGTSSNVSIESAGKTLMQPDTQICLFGKPEIDGSRRLGVTVARGDTVEETREKANVASGAIKVIYG